MLIEETLDQAIESHQEWKRRLIDAIEQGRSDFTVKRLASKDQCSFGSWLYSDAHAKDYHHYQTVERLHAKFHQSASEILLLALSHRGEEASRLMTSRSSFTVTSDKLVEELGLWKCSLKN